MPRFYKGNLVWAKIGKYPHWPSLVIDIKEQSQKGQPPKELIEVMFFADKCRTSWVRSKNIMKYGSRHSFLKTIPYEEVKKCTKNWQNAIVDAAAYQKKTSEEKNAFLLEMSAEKRKEREEARESQKTTYTSGFVAQPNIYWMQFCNFVDLMRVKRQNLKILRSRTWESQSDRYVCKCWLYLESSKVAEAKELDETFFASYGCDSIRDPRFDNPTYKSLITLALEIAAAKNIKAPKLP